MVGILTHAARPSGVPLVVDGTACSILRLLHTTWVSRVRRFDRRPCRQTRRVGNMFDRSAKSMKPARISFYGNFGAGNLGNECTLQAVIEQILRCWPDAQLLCFCANPQDVRTRHNIAAFPSCSSALGLGPSVIHSAAGS